MNKLYFTDRILALLHLLLDTQHDLLYLGQIIFLVQNTLPNFVHSLTIQLVVVLEGLDLVGVLESSQTILGHRKVEHHVLHKLLVTNHLRNGLEHQANVDGVEATG